MIQTLTGDNSYSLGQELKKRKVKFVSEFGNLALVQIDCSETSDAIAIEALMSLPFLSTKKLVIFRSLSSNSSLSQKFPELVKDIPETNDVIIVEEKIDKRISLYKFLKSKTEFKEFKALDLPATINWLTTQALAREASLSSGDARYLIERVGLDQERLDNELNKLALYNSKITKQTIDLLTENMPGSSIFELLEAAFNGNRKQVIKLYDEQKRQDQSPQQISAMLTWQLHIMTVVKTAGSKTADEIAKEAKLNPFVVRRSQSSVRSLTLNRISELVNKLVQIDKDSKSKNIDLDDALMHYLLSVE